MPPAASKPTKASQAKPRANVAITALPVNHGQKRTRRRAPAEMSLWRPLS